MSLFPCQSSSPPLPLGLGHYVFPSTKTPQITANVESQRCPEDNHTLLLHPQTLRTLNSEENLKSATLVLSFDSSETEIQVS